MVDVDGLVQAFRKGSVKSCLKLFIIPWEWHVVIIQTQKEVEAYCDTSMNSKDLTPADVMC